MKTARRLLSALILPILLPLLLAAEKPDIIDDYHDAIIPIHLSSRPAPGAAPSGTATFPAHLYDKKYPSPYGGDMQDGGYRWKHINIKSGGTDYLDSVVYDARHTDLLHTDQRPNELFVRIYTLSFDPTEPPLKGELGHVLDCQCEWKIEEWVPKSFETGTPSGSERYWKSANHFVLWTTVETEEKNGQTVWHFYCSSWPKDDEAFGKYLLVTAVVTVTEEITEKNPATGIDEKRTRTRKIRNIKAAATPLFRPKLTFNHNQDYNTFKDTATPQMIDGCNIDSDFKTPSHPYEQPEYPDCHGAARSQIGVLYRTMKQPLIKLDMAGTRPHELGRITLQLVKGIPHKKTDFGFSFPEIGVPSLLNGCTVEFLSKKSDNTETDTGNTSLYPKDTVTITWDKNGPTLDLEDLIDRNKTAYYFKTPSIGPSIDKGRIIWYWTYGIGKQGEVKLQYLPLSDVDNTYIVLDEPHAAPWLPRKKGSSPDGLAYDPQKDITPWFEALDFAILPVKCNTAGKSNPEDALNSIGNYLFAKHGVSYDHWYGDSFYLIGWSFDLPNYLHKSSKNYRDTPSTLRYHLNTTKIDWSKSKLVNCVDQAGSTTQLSRLIGLNASMLFTQPYGFINQCFLVGGLETNNPFFYLTQPHDPIVSSHITDTRQRIPFSMHCYTIYHTSVWNAIDACSGPDTHTCFELQPLDAYWLKSIDFNASGINHPSQIKPGQKLTPYIIDSKNIIP